MAIREATEQDLPAMLEIYRPFVEHTTVSFEYACPSPEEFRQRFLGITAQFPWLVWEEDGVVLGYAYGSRPFERIAYHWCAESSVYLAPSAQGRGVGRALYAALEDILTRQGYRVLYGLITEENEVSRKFHEALGFTLCGHFRHAGYKNGKWLDVVWMDKRLQPDGNPEKLPIPWKELEETL